MGNLDDRVTTGDASIVRQVADGTPSQAVDVLGPTVEFVTGPGAAGDR